MYAQYRLVKAIMCMPLGPDHAAKDGAARFVNPLTALSMVETMRLEGHTVLVHTVAASNLGKMLNRICQVDGVQLVNIIRSAEQEKMLHDMGATFVVDSSKDSFMGDLIDAVHETGAILAFDVTGGGGLASDILRAMEAAAAHNTWRIQHLWVRKVQAGLSLRWAGPVREQADTRLWDRVSSFGLDWRAILNNAVVSHRAGLFFCCVIVGEHGLRVSRWADSHIKVTRDIIALSCV